MGHEYNVPLRFLAITITRDNEAAPGNRLSDKHTKLFHGKTLDEWCAIQCWSSKHLGRHIFIAETEAHAKKLQYLTDKYGATVWVRPRDMLHPLNDSGGIILMWATAKALAEEWYTLVTHPFSVAPCRPPGFLDSMVSSYVWNVGPPDYRGHQIVVAGSETDGSMMLMDLANVGTQLGEAYVNKDLRLRFTKWNHFMALSHWYTPGYSIITSRHDTTLKPVIMDIEPWIDCHIDTQDQWDEAEFWFGKKILSQGEDCYERYRQSSQGA
jgi:hypothetical protein